MAETPEQRETRQRAFLDALIEKVRGQLDDTDGISAPVKPDNAIGRLSRLDAMQQQQMQLAIRRQRQEYLERLKSALRLVDKGRFGICRICGDDIPDDRLEIIPDTEMCTPCLRDLQEN